MDFQSIADSYATRYGIHPALFRRLVQAESSWNPEARSPVGALGLTQVMPDTARDPGFGITPLSNPLDPEDNLRFGAEYFSTMLNRYDGDVPRALAAYNWGPGNADRWDGSLSSLPEETRNYVQKITGGNGDMITTRDENGRMPVDALGRLATSAIANAEGIGMGGPALDQSIGATGLSVSSMNGGTQAGPEISNKGFLGWLMPDMTDDQRRERLLAIGAGLLSGENMAEGLGLAAQGLLGVTQREKSEASDKAALEEERQFQMQQLMMRQQMQSQSGSNRYDGQTFNIVGRDPETGQEVVRMGTVKNGMPHVFDSSGNLVPASQVMSDFRIGGRNETQDVVEGAGGIPNAVSVGADGTPSFKFQRQDEAKLYGYATRAIYANRDIEQITSMVGPEQMTSLEAGFRRWASANPNERVSVPVINSILDDAGVQGSARSAMSQYLQAVLRADTGAAYTAYEVADYASAFLPVTGEDPEVAAYKAAVRERTIRSMIGMTGAAAPFLNGVMDGTYQLPGQSFKDSYTPRSSTNSDQAVLDQEVEDILNGTSNNPSSDIDDILKGYGL